jgi:hypothetical protein
MRKKKQDENNRITISKISKSEKQQIQEQKNEKKANPISLRNINQLIWKAKFKMVLSKEEKQIIEIFKKKQKFADSMIDIFSFIRVKTEFEQLKMILLTENQRIHIGNRNTTLEQMNKYDDLFIKKLRSDI